MKRMLIRSEQPACKTCGKLMDEWNPFADEHEHGECAGKRIADEIFKKIEIQVKSREMAEYIYLEDRLTAPKLKGKECDAVRQNGKCIRGRMGTMLVSFDGKLVNVIAKRLRKLTDK